MLVGTHLRCSPTVTILRRECFLRVRRRWRQVPDAARPTSQRLKHRPRAAARTSVVLRPRCNPASDVGCSDRAGRIPQGAVAPACRSTPWLWLMDTGRSSLTGSSLRVINSALPHISRCSSVRARVEDGATLWAKLIVLRCHAVRDLGAVRDVSGAKTHSVAHARLPLLDLT